MINPLEIILDIPVFGWLVAAMAFSALSFGLRLLIFNK